jgi:hypothetical protein
LSIFSGYFFNLEIFFKFLEILKFKKFEIEIQNFRKKNLNKIPAFPKNLTIKIITAKERDHRQFFTPKPRPTIWTTMLRRPRGAEKLEMGQQHHLPIRQFPDRSGLE